MILFYKYYYLNQLKIKLFLYDKKLVRNIFIQVSANIDYGNHSLPWAQHRPYHQISIKYVKTFFLLFLRIKALKKFDKTSVYNNLFEYILVECLRHKHIK